MGCGGEWTWSRNGVRKVGCVRVRRNSPRGAIVLRRRCSAQERLSVLCEPCSVGCRGDVMRYRGISWKKWKMCGDDKDDKAWGVERGARHGALVFVYRVVFFAFNFLSANISFTFIYRPHC